MAKKKAQPEFKMSETIREILTANPKLSSKEVCEAVLAKHPNTKINEKSFSVAFYNARNKLGIGPSGRRRKAAKKANRPAAVKSIDLAKLQSAARFLSEVGGAAAAIEAIKQVQAVQVK